MADDAISREVFFELEYREVIGVARPIEGSRPREVDGRHGMSLAVADRCREEIV